MDALHVKILVHNYLKMDKDKIMLRTLLIYLSKADWAKRIITEWAFAWRVVSRFIAGTTIEDAIRVVKELNRNGINATLDHLGENTSNEEEAEASTQTILRTLDQIEKSCVISNVSIKLSQIGLKIDADLCERNLVCILRSAAEKRNFVRIDMEDSEFVEPTLKLYRRIRDVYGLDNTGVVIQSYLYRSKEDIDQLMSMGARVRLCKGTYKEPAAVAYPRKGDVDNAFDLLTGLLMQASVELGSPTISEDGKIPPIPAIASHDPKRLLFAKKTVESLNYPKSAIEFQMLYGIRRDLQDTSVKEGYPVRVYVPYGTQWYPYFMRRLAERPANLWFFVSNFLSAELSMKNSLLNLARSLFRIANVFMLFLGLLTYAFGAGLAKYLGGGVDWGAYVWGQIWVTTLQAGFFYINYYYETMGKPLNEETRLQRKLLSGLDLTSLSLIFGFACGAAIVPVTLMLLSSGFLTTTVAVWMVFSVFTMIFYILPPFRWIKSGYGEIVYALFLTLWIPIFSFVLQFHEYNQLVWLAAIPLIPNMLALMLALNFRQFASDVKTGRKNLLTGSGWRTGAVILIISILLSPLLSITMYLIGFPRFFLVTGLVMLPIRIAIRLVSIAYCLRG